MAFVEGLIGAALIFTALIGWRRLPGWRGRAAAGALMLAGGAAMLWLGAARAPVGDPEHRPVQVVEAPFTSSETCRACHPDNYASWKASYHRTMTQVATPESVLGDFDGAEVRVYGRDYRFERRGDRFWVKMDDPDWSDLASDAPRVWREIVLTTGSHHMQAYWFAAEKTRVVGFLPVAYDVAEDMWFPQRANFITPPLRYDRKELQGVGSWNQGCIQCHVTGGQPRVVNGDEMDTRVAEFGIACEACHGPAEAHVRANHNPQRRYRLHAQEEGDDTIVNPARLSHDLSSEICGRCHSVWRFPSQDDHASFRNEGIRYQPGMTLLEGGIEVYNNPGEDSSFWPDGMVRPSGREYSAMIESPCFERGTLSCFSCHSMHGDTSDPAGLAEWANDQLSRTGAGDEACLQCHEGFRENVELHTHHPTESSGSRCYNCHMPHTMLGLRKANRSHEIDSPTIQAELDTGRPNACNSCHLDQTLEWSARALSEWYDQPEPALDEEQRSVPNMLIHLLSGDAAQRALAAWHLGWDVAQEASGAREWAAPFLAQTLNDPYDPIRFISHRSLRSLPTFDPFEYDFVAPPDERLQRSRAAVQQWGVWRSARGKATDLARMMSRPGRELRPAIFEELHEKRNNRPVTVSE